MAHVQFDSSVAFFQEEHQAFLKFSLAVVKEIEKRLLLAQLSIKIVKAEGLNKTNYAHAEADIAWRGQIIAKLHHTYDSLEGCSCVSIYTNNTKQPEKRFECYTKDTNIELPQSMFISTTKIVIHCIRQIAITNHKVSKSIENASTMVIAALDMLL